MLNTGKVATSVLSLIQDNSTALRAKVIIWINMGLRALVTERTWLCMEKVSSTLSPVDGLYTLPTDFSKLLLITGPTFFLAESHRLIKSEVASITLVGQSGEPVGFTQTVTTLKLIPLSDVDITIDYEVSLSDYGDDQDTIFTNEFISVIERSIINFYYEYDMDERFGKSFRLDKELLKKLKIWDNLQQPLPASSKYMRD